MAASFLENFKFGYCVSQPFCHCDKYLRERKKDLIWLIFQSMVNQLHCFWAIERERDRRGRQGAQDKLWPPRKPPNDPLPPSRAHLLKFPEPPKTVPQAGDKAFNT
jgi:hypothetical protein